MIIVERRERKLRMLCVWRAIGSFEIHDELVATNLPLTGTRYGGLICACDRPLAPRERVIFSIINFTSVIDGPHLPRAHQLRLNRLLATRENQDAANRKGEDTDYHPMRKR